MKKIILLLAFFPSWLFATPEFSIPRSNNVHMIIPQDSLTGKQQRKIKKIDDQIKKLLEEKKEILGDKYQYEDDKIKSLNETITSLQQENTNYLSKNSDLTEENERLKNELKHATEVNMSIAYSQSDKQSEMSAKLKDLDDEISFLEKQETRLKKYPPQKIKTEILKRHEKHLMRWVEINDSIKELKKHTEQTAIERKTHEEIVRRFNAFCARYDL